MTFVMPLNSPLSTAEGLPLQVSDLTPFPVRQAFNLVW